MPPSYKELPVQIPQGVIGDTFNQKAIDFTDAEKIQAALRAQELNNQAVQLSVDAKQRQADQEKELRDALIAQYGGTDGMDGANFDPTEALNTAKRIALQSGDLNTALNIEKTQNQFKVRASGDEPLSPEQKQMFESQTGIPLPDGATAKDLNTLAALKRSQAYSNQVDIYANDPNRELSAEGKRQHLAGEQIRPASESQTQMFGEIEGLGNFVDNIKERYLPYISENRGERFLAAAVNSNSGAARMKNELDLVATQLAAAYNGKRLSDLDFKTMSKLIEVHDMDTMETVADRLDRLKEFMDMRKQNLISSMDAGGFNTKGFKATDGSSGDSPGDISGAMNRSGAGTAGTPEVAGSGTLPRNADGSPLSREQFMALRNKGN